MESFTRQRMHGIEPNGFRIEAMIPAASGKGHVRARIGLSRIDFTYALTDDISCIRLISGVQIPVALSLDALDDRIERNHPKDGGIIDLTDVTGDALGAQKVPQVALANQPVLPAKNVSTDGSFTIRAFVRQGSYNDEYVQATIESSHIETYQHNSDRPRSETRITLKEQFRKANDGKSHVYIGIAPKAFSQAMLQAQEQQQALLDFYEATRPTNWGRMRHQPLAL